MNVRGKFEAALVDFLRSKVAESAENQPEKPKSFFGLKCVFCGWEGVDDQLSDHLADSHMLLQVGTPEGKGGIYYARLYSAADIRYGPTGDIGNTWKPV